MTPKEIFEGKIAERLKNEPEKVKGMAGKVLFEITGPDGGQWGIDATKQPPEVISGSVPDPAVTLTITDEDFVKMLQGELKPEMAFLSGKLKVKGNMGIAMKLGQFLK